MDKKIVDKLIQFGLITNIGVDANKYTDIDDLIAKGIITIPGAKAKIMELISDDHIVIEELPVEEKEEEVVTDTPAVMNAETEVVEDVVVDTPAEAEVIETEVVVEEVVEDVEPETVEPETTTIEETPNKSKKSKKN